ncbi:mediator of RNA polymerase II transcription subunit 27-like [Telopea speciosissima]|uniref:mediator of RNA polymerase II transcription subunit 27-like n=1 Tax=Telopea speciosissima TaxID=54955 RepID=UPI001CC49023|nr:mediator of RNA polymerase II transcription subunit 27-like [Telopea speciosissima]XP_043701980.1 mediator of RNA polymerase II transcription subunit 27-like [Telopea speciosissima]
MQQQLQAPAATTPQPEPAESSETQADAPPKQVAMAMESLGRASRLIADIRIGADRLLEALFVTTQPHQSNKPLHLILKEEALMRQHFQDLRAIGRQLEDSGVLTGSLRSRSNSWGLHMPLVCPDGAVVAYAWKRQLAGQAGASAVDRARLALKAFTDQKRRFFPHLEEEPLGQNSAGESLALKKHCGSQASVAGLKEELNEYKTLSDVLMRLEKEVPNVRIFTYQRLDWLKRASALLSSAKENSVESSKEHNFNSSNKLRTGSLGAVASDQIAVVELVVPCVFRAIVSLHPPGSIDPDAVAFFSPDEGGSYIHSRGFSVYHVYRHISEHAVKALQYFLGIKADTILYLLLDWICSYQTLFTKVCSKCGRLLTMDSASALLLPPVHRPYWHSSATKSSSTPLSLSTRDLSTAYHIGCSSDEV